MNGSPYVPFYTSDFLGGTSGMTAATKGVYITLICEIYEVEGPLKQSWETLARKCGCTLPAFKKAIEALEDDGKIEVIDGTIWSEKCAKHLTLRRERQNSAKVAAETRWQKTKQKQRKADATASLAQCQPEPEPDTVVANATNSRARTRASRLPSDWVLPRDWGEWAVGEGWPETTIRREADKFKDYWIAASGQKATKLDWFATWRNWLRNVPKEDRNGNGNRRTSSRPSPHSTLFAAARSLVGNDDGGSADAFDAMRDVTPPGESGLADGQGGDTSQSFLRVIDGRN